MAYARVSKASPVYEYDTGRKYIIELVTPIWEVLTHAERTAFAYCLLYRMAITFDKMDNPKFGVNSISAGECAARLRFGDKCLPTPEQLAMRLKGEE